MEDFLKISQISAISLVLIQECKDKIFLNMHIKT